MEAILAAILAFCAEAGIKLLLALVVFIIGRFIIRKFLKIYEKGKFQAKLDKTVSDFLHHFIRISLYVVLVVSIIAILGVPMASVVTVIASCGVAIGLALQGALANVAGSIMILIFRPFNVGDYIATNGTEGTVKTISMFYTVLNTVDNKEVTIPNGALMNANIENMTSEEYRRVDLSFNVTNTKPVSVVNDVIMEAIRSADKAIKEEGAKAPFVAPVNPIPAGLEYTVRVWCKSEDYWDLYFDLMKSIPTALGEAEIGGPVPASKVVVNQ